MSHRPLYLIAQDVITDYRSRGKDVPAPALAYVQPMLSVESLTDYYGADSGDTLVAYALSNLNSWSGEKAREVKNEMREMLGLPVTRPRKK